MFDWVENKLMAKVFEMLSSLVCCLQVNQKNTHPENMCEKAKCRGGTINRTSVYAQVAAQTVL